MKHLLSIFLQRKVKWLLSLIVDSLLGMFKYEYLLAFSVTVWLTPTFLLFQE